MNAVVEDRIKCSCPLCYFTKWHTRDIVHAHLICKQFPRNYITWVIHGESNVLNNSPNVVVTHDILPPNNLIELLINEAFQGLRHEGMDASPSQVAGEEGISNDTPASNNTDFLEFLRDRSQELYDGFVWKPTKKNDNYHAPGTSKKQKKKSAKILRYFPLIPRLKTLFICSKIAEHMRWNGENVKNDGILRHPRDGPRTVGNNIDVYLQPLIKDLNGLWYDDVETFDSSKNEMFRMRAALMWTERNPLFYIDMAIHNLTNILFSKPRFCFEITESIARRYVYNSISKKQGERRLKLWDKTFDPLLSRSELMANVPKEISKDQWTSYVDYRLDKKTKKLCSQNAENRKKQTIPHIGGSKSNAKKRAEMMVEVGKKHGRATLYLATHKKEDGSHVNEAVKDICEKIELAVSQSTMDESEVYPNNVVGKVLGKEHSGRVRCLGLGVVPSRSFKQTHPRFNDAHKNCQENYKELLNSHNLMMNSFKAYMIMKEGTIPGQFAGFFTPPTPTDVSTGPLSDVNGRSSGDGYSSDNH
ncbi:putative protein isoform X1 [Capsicum chacoense]